tara:strand:- start:3613 stop:3837 length:225 start_codon:yes stop_codon:yes gene_type:complete
MGKYDHLEELRQKLASRARGKKVSSALVSLWLQFDQCLEKYRPSCDENDQIIKELRRIQASIRETISGGAEDNV